MKTKDLAGIKVYPNLKTAINAVKDECENRHYASVESDKRKQRAATRRMAQDLRGSADGGRR